MAKWCTVCQCRRYSHLSTLGSCPLQSYDGGDFVVTLGYMTKFRVAATIVTIEKVSGLGNLHPEFRSLDIRPLFPMAAKTDPPPAGGLLLISLEVTLRFTSISDVVGPSVGVWGRWHLLLGAGRFDKSMSNNSSNTSRHAASNQDLPLLLP